MLTQNEKQWLRERELLLCYSCKYCTGYHNQTCNAFEPLSSCWNRLCENFDFEYFDKEVFLDAVEFSERVAVKLARMSVDAMLPCFQANGDCPYTLPNCAWCRLMVARLSVEEEMDGEKDNS